MLVKDLMSTKPITASPTSSFSDLWLNIFQKHISGIPIVGPKSILLGIVAEEDIIEKLYPSYEDLILDPASSMDYALIEQNFLKASKLKASDLMNKEVFTTTENTPVMKAASSMLINKVSCLPVVSQTSDKPILKGIICKHDIFSYLFLTVLGKKHSQEQS